MVIQMYSDNVLLTKKLDELQQKSLKSNDIFNQYALASFPS
jgi:hypothetical protein